MYSFLSRREHHQPTVLELASTRHAQLVQQNYAKLMSILKCVLWCGRQNAALRGHRNDDKFIQSGFQGNLGNFKALLQFRVDSGDNVLKQHLKVL